MQNYWKHIRFFLSGDKTMKKKKNIKPQVNNSPDIPSQRRLKRLQEKAEKEKRSKEKSRNEFFRKRVRESSDKKAPLTLRTKAYYRFSQNYPSVVSPEGFRENTREKKSLSAKKRIAVFICCLAVFLLSFTLTETAVRLSSKPVDGTTDTPVISVSEKISGYHITPEELASSSAESILSSIKQAGCNTAVFEFKDEYGYVYFDINSFIGGSADKKIGSAWDTLNTLSDADIICAAYISCFKDTVAASSLSGMELNTSSGIIFKDNNDCCWLDPFSESAEDYLLNIIKKAHEGGFSYIILDNICYPTDFSVSSPVYSSGTAAEKNTALISFINKATLAAGNEKIITLCDISGFAPLSQIPNEKYGATLLDASCIAYSIDLRQEKQYTEQLKNADAFKYIEEMPLAFILDAGSLAKKQLQTKKEASVVFAFIDKDLADAPLFINHAGIENIIYW